MNVLSSFWITVSLSVMFIGSHTTVMSIFIKSKKIHKGLSPLIENFAIISLYFEKPGFLSMLPPGKKWHDAII